MHPLARLVRRTLLASLLAALSLGSLSAAPALQPVSDVPLPDPFVYREGDTWCIYGTSSYFLQGKSLAPGSLKRVELALEWGAQTPAQIWGFTVYKHTDGSYHAYATLHYGRFRTLVAHFVPQAGQHWYEGHPISGWKFDKVLAGDWNARRYAYESKIVRDGRDLYLVYCAGREVNRGEVCIMARRLLDPGTPDPSAAPRPILTPDGLRSEDRELNGPQLVEGASFAKVQGKWVLTYTVGNFEGDNRKIGVAYSDTLIPPEGQSYQKVLVFDGMRVWGPNAGPNEVKYLLQTQVRDWPNYAGDLLRAPGMGSILLTRGRYSLVFHAFKANDALRDPANRYVWVLPLDVHISSRTPMGDWIKPVLPRP